LYFGLQLIDLEHTRSWAELLAQSEEKYSFKSGGFSVAQLAAVREFVMLKYQRMIGAPGAEKLADVIMADISSLEQVKTGTWRKETKETTGVRYSTFELLNEVQGILGLDVAPGTEPIEELLDVVTKKACAFSIDRVLGY
jgi:hypothetical protein